MASISLDNDLSSLMDEMDGWLKTYSTKCNEVKELTSTIERIKNELRISKDNERRYHSQLGRKQESISQLQEILEQFSAQQEKNLTLGQENEKLKEEIVNIKKLYSGDKENWNKEKLDIFEKQQKEMSLIKANSEQDVSSLKMEITKIKESNINSIQCVRNEMLKREREYKHSMSLMISNYEEELSKLNGDLASAQTEIKMLRERCAANMNLYKTIHLEKSVAESPEDSDLICNSRFAPKPIVTGQSLILNECAVDHVTGGNEDKCFGIQKADQSFGISIKKTKLSSLKKRKLYCHTDNVI